MLTKIQMHKFDEVVMISARLANIGTCPDDAAARESGTARDETLEAAIADAGQKRNRRERPSGSMSLQYTKKNQVEPLTPSSSRVTQVWIWGL
jgi:hypothetical protein